MRHHSTYEGVAPRAAPSLPMAAFPSKYFLAPASRPDDKATQGVEARQLAVYNLETAHAWAFDAWFRSQPGASHVDLSLIDATAWDAMSRWWAINDLLAKGYELALYDSKEAAQHAVEAMQDKGIAQESEAGA